MALRRQKSLVLILAREFASQLTMPMFIIDAEGDLVFYNEPAERILGQSFGEAGELTGDQLEEKFPIRTLDGRLLERNERAVGTALFQHKATHARHQIRGVDGVWRTVSVTAFPLLTTGDEFQGVIAIFWENPEE